MTVATRGQRDHADDVEGSQGERHALRSTRTRRSVRRAPPRLYYMKEEADGAMMGEMAGEGIERGVLSELYVAYAPDGIRLAFLLLAARHPARR